MALTDQQPRASRSPEEIDRFRRERLTVDNLLGELDAGSGALLLAHAPGLGKTTLIDTLIERQITVGTPYGVVIYATSQRHVLFERPWLVDADSDVAVLVGRPRARCGPLDAAWVKLEAARCGTLGRSTVGARCSERPACPWPEQMSPEALAGKRVVATLQSYLAALSDFVPRVVAMTGAERPLVIIDEALIVNADKRAVIHLRTVEQSVQVFRRAAGAAEPKLKRQLQPWLELHTQLLDREQRIEYMPSLPWLLGATAEQLQRTGIEMFGDHFRYLGFELQALTQSSRWRDGDRLYYVHRPVLRGVHYVVAAAHMPQELARHRLDDQRLEEFCHAEPFVHEGTRFYNLRTSHGMRCYFSRNAPQVVFLFAQLIAQQAAMAKRSIAVTKKCFAVMVAFMLQADLRELTGKTFRVLVNPSPDEINDPLIVPLITYGIEGVNAYSGFDAAFAITGFYAREDALEERLNDAHAPGEDVPVVLVAEGGRRRLRALRHWDRRAGFDPLVESYQRQYEDNVVLQALGRVRFVTQPRLVIAFQVNTPDVPTTKVFRRLDDLRRHFGLSTRRSWVAVKTRNQVKRLADSGLTAAEIVDQTGLPRSTVYRVLEGACRPTKP